MSIAYILKQVPDGLVGEDRDRYIAAIAIRHVDRGNLDIDTRAEANHEIDHSKNRVLVCGNISSGISTVYGMFTEEEAVDVKYRIVKDRPDLEHWCFRYEVDSTHPRSGDDLILVKGSFGNGIEEVLRVPDMTQIGDFDWVGPITPWKGHL